MFDFDRWQQIYSVLKKNKLRTLLTAFGVFWGIFMLMIMLASGTGLRNGVTHGFRDFATNSMFMWTNRTTVPYHGFQKGRRFFMKKDDVEALRTQVSGINQIAPRVSMGSSSAAQNNVVHGLKGGSFQISGDYPAFNEIDPTVILKGRFINQNDLKHKRKVAVIGERVEEELFEPDEDVLGEYIRIQGVYFQVIGVVKPRNPNIQFGGDKARMITVPFSSFQQAFNFNGNIYFMAVTGKKNVPVSEIEDQVVNVIKKRHHVAPEDDQAVRHFNFEEQFKKMTSLFTGIDVLVWIVGIGTLLAGVIGVSNIMLIVVKERTKEIGIQRAIGAPPKTIMHQIILESLVLTFIAGYAGLVAGTVITELLNMALSQAGGDNMMFRNPQINFNIAVISIFVLSVFGILAGILPARRALQIKPIEAIHDE